ncbi:DNA polymerase III subunit gamma/tau [Myxococcota bacterium]|nr:DNA polymerase III subunit gamma/tau [Myxococcota bacterium]MBU1411696.1 DNA polymerase III subunit gamma/tau [Myxococcota bacterium]
MAYLVLARRYRPQTFSELVGQDHIVTILSNAITGGRVHHAFLFTGARGTGKTTTARILAKSLNCVEGPTTTPCNKCHHCADIAASKDVDVLEIDGATNTGVDSVRALREDIRYLPSSGRYRIVIIDEVHMLTTSAFNALLKTLEEPPPHVIFILATTEPHKIPATILSRVQRFDFHRVDTDVLTSYLMGLLQSEGFTSQRDALRIIALEGEGSVRDSLSILDQVLAHHTEGEITAAEVSHVLGLSDRQALLRMGFALLSGQREEVFEILETVFCDGSDLVHFTKSLAMAFRDLVLCRLTGNPGRFLSLTPEELLEIQERTAVFPVDHIYQLFSRIFFGIDQVARASSARLALEMLFCELLLAQPLVPLTDLFSRLENLEQGKPATLPALSGPAPTPRTTTAPKTPATPKSSPATGPAALSGPAPAPNEARSPAAGIKIGPDAPAKATPGPKASPAPAPAGQHPASPAAPPAPPAPAPETGPAPTPVIDLQAWLAFISVIRPTFATMSMLLDDGRFCGTFFEDGKLQIHIWFSRGKHDFNFARLADSKRVLDEQLSLHLGVPSAIHLTQSDKPPVAQELSSAPQGVTLAHSAREVRERQMATDLKRQEEEMKNHPFVRQLLDHMHGEVVDFTDLT